MQIWFKKKQGSCCTSELFVAQIQGAQGFSLVELITVVAVIAALAAIALPAGANYVNRAKIARCLGDLQTINNEIQAYYIDRNSYPGSLSDIGRGSFTDPWGQLYMYNNIVTNGNPLMGTIDQLNSGNDYDLYSKGADLQTNSPDYDDTVCEDDIVRASDGSFFGKRKDF
jgi:general secretion pathway protein G